MTEFETPSEPAEVLADDGVILRPIREQDAGRLFELYEQNREHLEAVNIYTPIEEWEVAAKVTSPFPAGRIDFGIWDGDDLAGEIDLIPQGPHRAEIIYWIDTQHRRKGYAARAISALSAHARDELGIDTIRAWIDRDNIPSMRTLEKAGYKHAASNPQSLCFEFKSSQSE